MKWRPPYWVCPHCGAVAGYTVCIQCGADNSAMWAVLTQEVH